MQNPVSTRSTGLELPDLVGLSEAQLAHREGYLRSVNEKLTRGAITFAFARQLMGEYHRRELEDLRGSRVLV